MPPIPLLVPLFAFSLCLLMSFPFSPKPPRSFPPLLMHLTKLWRFRFTLVQPLPPSVVAPFFSFFVSVFEATLYDLTPSLCLREFF